jgi:hypothetical protein
MHATAIMVSGILMTASADTTVRVDGRGVEMQPPPIVEGGDVFVTLESFAKAVGLEAKVVAENRLVVLCNDVTCIPVPLKPGWVREIEGTKRVSLRALAEAAGYAVSVDAGGIDISTKTVAPAKLAEGSMLPDVTLTDLEGKPVHTSDFIGKRILICTWASW